MIVMLYSQPVKHVIELNALHVKYHTTFTKDNVYQHVKMEHMIQEISLVQIVFPLVQPVHHRLHA